MALNFQQKLILKDGSVLLYHEARLQSGEVFHIVIHVPGNNIEAYFTYIAATQDFAVRELEKYGNILRCDTGTLDSSELARIAKGDGIQAKSN